MSTSKLFHCSALVLLTTSAASAAAIYGVTAGNTLVRFDSSAPGTVSTIGAISGLAAGDAILGIDMRPATGELFALGRERIYTIDTRTGGATSVGGGAFSLGGTSYGFDFNPTVDRIRVTDTAGINLRLNPSTGEVAATDTNLAYSAMDVNAGQAPSVGASAYTNSFRNSTSTTLYNIDTGLNVLVTQIPPNAGTLNTIGSLGVDPSEVVGFDIEAITNNGFAAFTFGSGGPSQLYSVNLATGAATLIGEIGTGAQLTSIAISQVPEPATFGLFGVAAGGLALMRRRRRS